jgi:hypothetical protein
LADAAPVTAPPAVVNSGADGFGALLTVDSGTAGGAPLAFAATGEVATPRPAPRLAPDDGIVDLLAAPAMSL